ncbi:MAG: macro domain-containing protein [Bacteroidota bacterium]
MPGKTLLVREWNNVRVEIVEGDLTEETVDAIVNAANANLDHGGGVARAIVMEGGEIIQQESRRIGRVKTGHAVHTGAGLLQAKYVIHTVGPIWNDGESGEQELLADAVRSSLTLASELHCESISMPAISSGIYGFPKLLSAEIIIRTIRIFINTYSGSLRKIRCTNIDAETAELFCGVLEATD